MDEKPEPAAEDAGDAGQHCGLDRLIAYRQGTLPAAEREQAQEHLSLCARCTGLLRELRDFEASAAGGDSGSESLREEAWDSLVRHLPAATPVIRPATASTDRHTAQRRRAPRYATGIAAALLLALLGFSVWAAATVLRERQRLARLEQQLEERESALSALQTSLAEAERQLDAARRQVQELSRPGREKELEATIAELSAEIEKLRGASWQAGRDRIASAQNIAVSVAPWFALRGQGAPETEFLRGGGVANPVRKTPQQDRFTVVSSLAGQPVYEEYRLELADQNRKVLWEDRWPRSSLLGDAGTSVSIRGLDPGLYRLRIHGLHPDRSELLAEYLLDVGPG